MRPVREAGARPGAERKSDAADAPPHRMIEVRRMMVEYGESFWRDGWGPLYSVLGGNPLAAMPSLHFATSVMAALLLSETGRWRARWVGVCLDAGVRAGVPRGALRRGPARGGGADGGGAPPGAARRPRPSSRCARAVAALEARAHGDGICAVAKLAWELCRRGGRHAGARRWDVEGEWDGSVAG